jgi:hypothetical protein
MQESPADSNGENIRMNPTKLAELATEFMNLLEAEHPDEELIEVAIVVELRNRHNEVSTPTACSNDSRIYQTGIFQWGLDNVQWSGSPIEEPEEDEDAADEQ